MENKIKISNNEQIQRLVQLMEENPQIARGIGQFGCSRQEMADTWVRFATQLNALGPPTRNGPEWQRVWVHYKANLKRKLSKNKSNFMATGGGPLQELSLSPSEERVLELTHINKSINSTAQVLGIIDLVNEDNATSVPQLVTISTPAAIPVDTTTPKTTKTTINKTAEAKRMDILSEQISIQKEMLKVHKNIEKYAYKSYELKKKKVEMLARSLEEEKELRQVNLEIAKRKLAQLEEYSV